MALGRLLRAFMAPAPDPRLTYRDAAGLESELRAERLALAERRLRERLDALIDQERRLTTRRGAAETQLLIGLALAAISDELADFAPGLARTEQEAEALEARVAAIARLLDAQSKI